MPRTYSFKIIIPALAVAACFAVAAVAYAQFTEPTANPPAANASLPWTVNGTNVYTSPAITGNVGIGTTGPNTLFHVQGSSAYLTLAGTAASPVSGTNLGRIVGRNSAYVADVGYINFEGDGTFSGGSYPSRITFYTNPSTGGSNPQEKMRITTIGNVGIGTGTIDPASKLHLYDAASGPILTISGATTVYRGITVKNTAGTEQWFYGPSTSNNFVVRRNGTTDDLTVNSSGNVGIGTASPSYKLDVNGAIRGNYLSSAGGTCAADQVLKRDAAGTAWTCAADSTGSSLPAGTSGQTLRHDGSAWAANSLLFNNGTNVGIGTIDPDTKLAITGNVPILSIIEDSQNGSIGADLGSINFLDDFTSANDAAQASILVERSAASTGATDLPTSMSFWTTPDASATPLQRVTILDDGNVGIGTASPSYKLDVNGAIRGNFLSSAGGTCAADQVLKRDAAGTAWTCAADSTGSSLPAGASGQTLRHDGSAWAANSLLFNNGTNVGIGTTGPNTLFHVQGSSAYLTLAGTAASPVSGTNLGRIVGRNSAYGADVGYINFEGDGTFSGGSYPSRITFYTNPSTGGSNPQEKMRITTIGNVGIGTGTTDPASKLHLYDAASGPILTISGATTVYRGITVKNTAGTEQWFYGPNATNNFVVRRNGTTDDLTVNSSGNVGIGTTGPGYKLDVSGDIRSTTNIYANDKIITSRYGHAGTYNSAEVQGIWSIGDAFQIDTGLDNFGTLYGMGYAYNQNGGSPFASQHQIVFTNNGVINAAIGFTSGTGYFAGSVGIGTTAPAAKLHVQGQAMFGSASEVVASGQNLIYGNVDTTSTGNLLLLQKEGNEKFKVTTDGITIANNLRILGNRIQHFEYQPADPYTANGSCICEEYASADRAPGWWKMIKGAQAVECATGSWTATNAQCQTGETPSNPQYTLCDGVDYTYSVTCLGSTNNYFLKDKIIMSYDFTAQKNYTQITDDLRAPDNVRSSCEWLNLSGSSYQCPEGKYLAGYNNGAASMKWYCCGL